jgi:hypothetical protein
MRRPELHAQLARPDRSRVLRTAMPDDQDLRELRQLPGTWANLDPEGPRGTPFGGRGWNCIAVPFIQDPPPGPVPPPGRPIDYRLLVNQFNEELRFSTVDDDVPNRGVSADRSRNVDQFLVALDYEQKITQVAVDDNPASKIRGKPGAAIHHEPGLFLNMVDDPTTSVNTLPLARLGTIPHGDALLALGTARERTGPDNPVIPDFPGLPVGVPANFAGYLAPYNHFHTNLFQGIYDPTKPTALLNRAFFGGTPFGPEHTIVKTTEFVFDTTFGTGGIHNVPFVINHANATEMKFQMWILKVQPKDPKKKPVLVLQYAQLVFLDFFPRLDGQPGPIRWPHVSINTLIKVEGPPSVKPQPPATSAYPKKAGYPKKATPKKPTPKKPTPPRKK